MEKTVILVIDRDNDFGCKADVVTPCIGLEACEKAAVALATADPEDSDSNALFNAIKTYKSMLSSRPAGSLEIALICGDKDVGFMSDQALSEQLQDVIDTVQPKNAFLVTDGAEDEGFFRVIASRIKIIGTQKTIVKQIPSVEGTLAILSRYLKEPQKRIRFISPIAYILIAISLVYLFTNWVMFDNLREFILNSTTVFLIGVLGVMLLLYAYGFPEWVAGGLRSLKGSYGDAITIGAVVFSILFLILALILGVYSLDSVYTYRFVQKVTLFGANAMWPLLFIVLTINFASVLSGYLRKGTVKYSNIVACVLIVGVGLIATAFADYLLDYVSVTTMDVNVIAAELLVGFLFIFLGGLLNARLKKSAEPAPLYE